MRLALLGPPGSGKGTQGALLHKALGIPHISSGALLRDAISRRTPLGLKAKDYMDEGHLVPDELVLDMMRQRLSGSDCQSGFLLDGFPRTLSQAEALESMLDGSQQALEHVVALVVLRDEIVKRLAGRRSCPACGHLYHVALKPPKVDGRCDDCGGELIVRDDDREETIGERLEVYGQLTQPLLAFYSKAGLLREVEGQGEPEEVSSRIFSRLGVQP